MRGSLRLTRLPPEHQQLTYSISAGRLLGTYGNGRGSAPVVLGNRSLEDKDLVASQYVMCLMLCPCLGAVRYRGGIIF